MSTSAVLPNQHVALHRTVRLSIVGLGVVGRWLAESVERRRRWLAAELGVDVVIVSAATDRGGFVYREDGLDVPTLVTLAAAGRPLAEHPGTTAWKTAAAGLAATPFDVLAEASNTDPRRAEPALSYMRLAITRGAHVITSSKGACADSAIGVMAQARARGVAFRMESTVMSGTPVLSTIQDGLAGARVTGVRGVLNGTANYILTRMGEGLTYASALSEAQQLGYAEPDPVDDVEGHDTVAKARILAAVAFGRSLGIGDVARHGITNLSVSAVSDAVHAGMRVRLVASLRPAANGGRHFEARVEPVILPLTDPLARVDGVMNAVVIETDTTSPVTIVGPGAGRDQAGQGVFADLIATIRSRGGPGRGSSA